MVNLISGIFGLQEGKEKHIPVKRLVDFFPCKHWLKYNKSKDSYTCRVGCGEFTSGIVKEQLINEKEISQEERDEIEKETYLPYDHRFYFI